MGAHEAQTAAVSCCSGFYEQDWVRQITAECFHPGGEALTRRTITAMQLPAGAHVLDLGCGAGTSSLLLAREYAYHVIGADISTANIQHASDKARQTGLNSDQLHFITAAAGALPLAQASCDGVLCECTLSLFPDQAQVLRDIHRILKPGGQLAITDMALESALPADMAQTIAPWTCLTGALSRQDYEHLFHQCGFTITEHADESDGLHRLLAQLKRQLVMVGAAKAFGGSAASGLDLGTIKYWMDRFATEINNGVIRYLRFHLVKGI